MTNLEIEDYFFVKNNGEERHFVEIVKENMERASDNYYHGLTPVNEFFIGGSNLHLVIAQSRLQYDIEYLIEMTFGNNLIQNASGDDLDDIGAKKGIFRGEAEFADDVVTFSIPLPLTSPLDIYEGTELATDEMILFTTSEDAVIEVGQTSVTVPIVCLEAGTIGNVFTGAINDILNITNADLTVTNNNNITSGVDGESDDDFRQRIIESTLNYPVGTSRWYEKLAETLVSSALYNKTSSTTGTLVYKPSNGINSENEFKLEELFNKKENQVINNDLRFQEGTPVSVIDSEQRIIVVIDDNYSWDIVSQKITNNMNNYVNNLPLGGFFKKICASAMVEQTEGVITFNLEGYEDVELTNEEYAKIDELNIVQG